MPRTPRPSLKVLDLTGRPFGLLTVESFAGLDARGRALWRCRCACGRRVKVPANHLRRLSPGSSKDSTSSCGECSRYYDRRFTGETGGYRHCFVCRAPTSNARRTCSPECRLAYEDVSEALTFAHAFFARRKIVG